MLSRILNFFKESNRTGTSKHEVLKSLMPHDNLDEPFTAEEAQRLIYSATTQPTLRFKGRLSFNSGELNALHTSLVGDAADFSGRSHIESLPPNMNVRHLKANKCPALKHIGAGLRAWHLELRETALIELPDDLQVEFKIDLTGCTKLQRLPKGLKTGVLILAGCEALQSLPDEMDLSFLDITGCKNLIRFPASGRLHCGRLVARDCVNLEALPDWIEPLAALDLRGCAKLRALPAGIRVDGWIDIAGTQITALPQSLRGVGLRWRGVPVTEQIVFRPETLAADDVLKERNAEVRRVILERVGFERFLELAHAKVLDTDRDKGGERRLVHVDMNGDEDLRCVSFICPSTGRQYIIRVPPTVSTCHAAVAWMAGFDNPDEYNPAAES
jgi:hypothetical protein